MNIDQIPEDVQVVEAELIEEGETLFVQEPAVQKPKWKEWLTMRLLLILGMALSALWVMGCLGFLLIPLFFLVLSLFTSHALLGRVFHFIKLIKMGLICFLGCFVGLFSLRLGIALAATTLMSLAGGGLGGMFRSKIFRF